MKQLIDRADAKARQFKDGGIPSEQLELWLVGEGFYGVRIREDRVAASYNGIAYILGVRS